METLISNKGFHCNLLDQILFGYHRNYANTLESSPSKMYFYIKVTMEPL